MSNTKAGNWLFSHHPSRTSVNDNNLDRLISPWGKKSTQGRAKTVSLVSGKGGVGKTSVSIKMTRMLANQGYKVLLIDCDTNLANTSVKLGLPLQNDFFELVSANKNFEDVVYRDGNFHLLAACNGSLELFESKLELDKIIIDIISAHEEEYDFIFLDSPAGIGRETLSLCAYTDFRFVVVTPDKSSITDSYSLIKILNQKYGVKENHLFVNKISEKKQYQRLIRTMTETVGNFLDCRLQVLGGISLFDGAVDQFDRELEKNAGSHIHKQFFKVVGRFAEECVGTVTLDSSEKHFNYAFKRDLEQDVQSTL